MKTLREEIVELLMDRIGVAENEEFEAQCGLCRHSTFKFCKGGILFEKIEEEWIRSLLYILKIMSLKRNRNYSNPENILIKKINKRDK